MNTTSQTPFPYRIDVQRQKVGGAATITVRESGTVSAVAYGKVDYQATRVNGRSYVNKMKTVDLGNSKILNLIFKPAGMLMGSRFRKWLMDPGKTLQAADIQPAQTILEVGCGTGFFTLPAAQIIGDQGCLIAMDPSTGFLKEVAQKVQTANFNNVRLVRRDALDTGLETESIDKVLLFGVLPFPLLPLDRLLPEMHRVLKVKGTMAVWLFPRLVHSWVPRSILHSGLFKFTGKGKGVYNYERC